MEAFKLDTRYYLVDADGKHEKDDYRDLLSAVKQRALEHFDSLSFAACPLDIKLRRIDVEGANIREIYAFVFSDERGAI